MALQSFHVNSDDLMDAVYDAMHCKKCAGTGIVEIIEDDDQRGRYTCPHCLTITMEVVDELTEIDNVYDDIDNPHPKLWEADEDGGYDWAMQDDLPPTPWCCTEESTVSYTEADIPF